MVPWQVHYKFKLLDETLFLTVNIIARFLEKQVIPREKLHLVGVTAMLLACKFEERQGWAWPPWTTTRARTLNPILTASKLWISGFRFKKNLY
jgi:hypothetical protein